MSNQKLLYLSTATQPAAAGCTFLGHSV